MFAAASGSVSRAAASSWYVRKSHTNRPILFANNTPNTQTDPLLANCSAAGFVSSRAAAKFAYMRTIVARSVRHSLLPPMVPVAKPKRRAKL